MRQRTLVITILTGIICLIAGGVIGFFIGHAQGAKANITSYQQCAAAGYPIQETSPERCAIPGGKTFTNDIAQEAISLTGRVICLLHKDMDGPHTLECATGFKTDTGASYTLNTEQSGGTLSESAGSERRVRIEGTLKKEVSNTYQSEGTITVTSFDFIEG